jgi:hypothetical protein
MAAVVVTPSVVGSFKVGTRLVTGSQAKPVYPPGFVASICGAVICGDGHVLLGTPSGQFGTPVVVVNVNVGVPVSGLGSAQAFGTSLVKASIVRLVGGVPSAQAFGVFKINQRFTIPGLGSAQAFGVPWVGHLYFWPSECEDETLLATQPLSSAPVATICSTLTLTPTEYAR